MNLAISLLLLLGPLKSFGIQVDPQEESDIYIQFQNLPYQPDVLQFKYDKGNNPDKYTIYDKSCKILQNNHFQGIQRVSEDVFIISGGQCKVRGKGSTHAELLVFACSNHTRYVTEDSVVMGEAMPGPLFRHNAHAVDRQVSLEEVITLNLNKDYGVPQGYWHAGGIGLHDSILCVPIENSTGSSVISFFDISNPFDPKPISGAMISRSGAKAGTSALYFEATLERYICVVWSDSDDLGRRFDFYVSFEKDINEGFKYLRSIRCGGDHKVKYQQIQLMKDRTHGLVLLCSENSGGIQPVGSGDNVVDLLKVHPDINHHRSLVDIDTVTLLWKKDFLKSKYYDFDASASFYQTHTGQLIMYSLHHFHYKGDRIVISEFASNDPYIAIESISDAYVELYSEKEFKGQKLTFRGAFKSPVEFSKKSFRAQLRYFPQQVQSIKYKLPKQWKIALSGNNRRKNKEAIFEGKGHEVACPDLKLCRMDVIGLTRLECMKPTRLRKGVSRRPEFVEEMLLVTQEDSFPKSDHILAGFGRTSLNPPPGSYMAGYSVSGKQAVGLWTDLYASTLYLQGSNGEPLFLINTDLWGVSAGMHKKVIELFNKKNGTGAKIGMRQVVLSATHTHNGPGNYMSSFLYNNNSSCKPGYDPVMFDFLTERIAQSMVIAFDSKLKSSLGLNRTSTPRLSRNRSLEAFKMNHLTLISEVMSQSVANEKKNTYGTSTDRTTMDESLLSVDNKISLLRIETADSNTTSFAIFFSAHPTVLGAASRFISSDVVGVTRQLVEGYFAHEGSQVNTLFFNGAEGDVSFNWQQQNRTEVIRIAKSMAHYIIAAITNGDYEPLGTEVKNLYTEQSLPHQIIIDEHDEVSDTYDNDYVIPRTSPKPKYGMPTIGGAEDGRTLLYDVLPNTFREGNRKKSNRPPNGTKKLWPILRPIVAKHFIKDCFPFEVPLSIHYVGGIPIVTLPGEFTMMSGHRIKKLVSRLSRDTTYSPSQEPLLIGLANEYISYVTTPQEYELQHYEGSSNIYGSMSQLLIENTITRLIEEPRTEALPDTLMYIYYPWLSRDSIANNYMDKVTLKPKHLGEILTPFVSEDEGICRTEWSSGKSRPFASIEIRSTQSGWDTLELKIGISGDISFPQKQTQTDSPNFLSFPVNNGDSPPVWQLIWIYPKEDFSDDALDNIRFKIRDTPGDTTYGKCLDISF